MSIKKVEYAGLPVSLEDGRQYRSLKRHLAGKGLSPAEYREKWGLRDYPMIAPSYAAQRSELAKKIGLGRKAIVAKPAKKGGRRKAA